MRGCASTALLSSASAAVTLNREGIGRTDETRYYSSVCRPGVRGRKEEETKED